MTYQDHLRTFFKDSGPIADAVVKCAIAIMDAREASGASGPAYRDSALLLNDARAYHDLAVALEAEDIRAAVALETERWLTRR